MGFSAFVAVFVDRYLSDLVKPLHQGIKKVHSFASRHKNLPDVITEYLHFVNISKEA